jgi:hypothetical protein
MEFIGREEELKFLEKKYNTLNSEFIIVYGRRRLGKTRLLKKSIENKKSTYYLAVEESVEKNIEYFRSLLAQHLNNSLIEQINTNSWSEFFRLIIDLIPQNYIFIFDEFPYLVKQDKSIISHFQKIYDEYLKDKGIKLILCGSSTSIMGDLMQYQSPLYGRRTGVIKLKELSYFEVSQFLSKIKDLEEITNYYLIFGGIPYYLEQIDQKSSFKQNFMELFLEGQSLFLDEVNFLLKEEFREVRNYLSIFKAIAKGKNKFTEISYDTLIEKGSLSKYLTNLEILELINNKKSFFDKANSKKTIYTINDNFIYFWFSTLDLYISELDNKEIQNKIFKTIMPRNFGFLFEKVCHNILKKHYEKVGTYFRDNIEIDILGQKNNTIDCFECKYTKNSNEKQILEKLNNKVKYLPDSYKYNTKIISINSGINLKKLLELSK